MPARKYQLVQKIPVGKFQLVQTHQYERGPVSTNIILVRKVRSVQKCPVKV